MKRGIQAFVIVILLAACMVIGVIIATSRRQEDPVTRPPAPTTAIPVIDGKVQVYGVDFNNGEPILDAVEIEIEPDAYPPEAAIRYLIEQGDMGDLSNPIPEGARLIGLSVENGLATIDVSRQFSDDFTGGSMAESLIVRAIVRTLGQFPEIKRVQILLEGETLGTLGHLDLMEPIDVEWAKSQFGGNN